jgi:membrane protein implicated in regulation of membrane protease activity
MAGLGLGIGLQLLAFAVTAGAMITLVRPVARRHLTGTPQLRSGVAALIGREAIVLRPVGREAGLVRIGGEEWTARSYDPDLQIPAGARVDVFAIEGATALVHPREDPWPN